MGEAETKTECRIRSISQRLSHDKKKKNEFNVYKMFVRVLNQPGKDKASLWEEARGKKTATASLILYIKFLVIVGVLQ